MAFGDLKRGLAYKVRPAKVEPEPVAVSDDPRENADAVEVLAEVSRLRALLEKVRPAPVPVSEPWGFGFGAALGAHPRVPARVRELVGKLDRFGGLRITPETVEVDGEEVEWSQVTAVRTRNLVEYLVADSVGQQIEQLPIPPFPGRTRVVDSLSQAVLTLVVAYAKDASHGAAVRIPAEIEYRGGRLKRVKQLSPGTFSALILADHAVSGCLVATAQARGVPVSAAMDEMSAAAEQRAAAIRVRIAALESRLSRSRP